MDQPSEKINGTGEKKSVRRAREFHLSLDRDAGMLLEAEARRLGVSASELIRAIMAVGGWESEPLRTGPPSGVNHPGFRDGARAGGSSAAKFVEFEAAVKTPKGGSIQVRLRRRKVGR